jgi:hypothetical protein
MADQMFVGHSVSGPVVRRCRIKDDMFKCIGYFTGHQLPYQHCTVTTLIKRWLSMS